MPWFTLADIWQLRDGAQTEVRDTAEGISPRGLANSAAVRHPAGTVLLSRTASVGFSGVMATDMAVSQDFMTWTPGPRLRSRYLLWTLRGMADHLRGLMYGSTHKTIYMPDLLALQVPLPPLHTQDQIADFLDLECARIDELAEAVVSLEGSLSEGLQSVIDETLRSDEHDELSLGRIGCRCVTGPFGTVLAASEYIDDGIPLVNPSHIKEGRIVPSSGDSVSEVTARRLERYRLRVGDLVVGRKGDLGRAALVGLREDGWLCGSDSIALRPALDRVDPRFLAGVMQTTRVRHGLLARSSGMTMANMNERSLLACEMPVMSVAEQRRRIDDLAAERTRVERLQAELRQLMTGLMEYRDSLITEAVTGRIDVATLDEQEMAESLAAVRDIETPKAVSR